MKKHKYRIRNWSEYNASLKKRGSLTVWVRSEAIENWTTDELTGEPGSSPTYTDPAIETMTIVQAIYGFAGRQTQGFLQSIFELMKLDLTSPDHLTLSRRRRQLEITLPVRDWSRSRHLVIDSTGVKVYGEGEWKVRQAKAQRSGSTQTQRPNGMRVTRIYGASEKSGAKSGRERATIIAGAWRRLRSSASQGVNIRATKPSSYLVLRQNLIQTQNASH